MWYLDDEGELSLSVDLNPYAVLCKERQIFEMKGSFDRYRKYSGEGTVDYLERREREILSTFKKNYREWPVCCGIPTNPESTVTDDIMRIRFKCGYCKEYVTKDHIHKGKIHVSFE